LGISLFAQQFPLTVDVKNNPTQEFYLADFYGDKNTIIDTARADTAGRAVFMLNSSHPVGMYRVYIEPNSYFDLLFNREEIHIETDYNDLYEGLTVHTSQENKLYYDFLRTRHDYRLKFDLLAPVNDYYPPNDSFFHYARAQYIAIQADMQLFVNEIIESFPESWAARIIDIQRPLFYDPSMDETDRRNYKKEHFFDAFHFDHPELIRSNVYTSAAIEYMSLYSNPNFTQEQLQDEFIKAVDKIMYEAMDNNLIYEFIVEYLVGGFERYGFDKVLDYIAETYTPEQCENEERKSDLQTRLEKYAELSVGKAAPEIRIPDRDGKDIRLKKIDSEYLLIVFWASWCPHCNEMLPEIHNIYQSSINPRNMEILSISLDNEKEEWISALDAEGYTWLNASDLGGWDSPAAIAYNVYATPTMYLLDKDKTIIAKPITMKELKDALFRENILK
jgi:peroxiredoxin